jgi:hypothetical protein
MVRDMTTPRTYERNPKTVLGIQFNSRADVDAIAEMLHIEGYGVIMDGPTRLVIVTGKRKFYVRETDWIIMDKWGLVNTLSNTAFVRDYT